MIKEIDTYPMFDAWDSHKIQFDLRIEIFFNFLSLLNTKQLLKIEPIQQNNQLKRIIKTTLSDYVDKIF